MPSLACAVAAAERQRHSSAASSSGGGGGSAAYLAVVPIQAGAGTASAVHGLGAAARADECGSSSSSRKDSSSSSGSGNRTDGSSGSGGGRASSSCSSGGRDSGCGSLAKDLAALSLRGGAAAGTGSAGGGGPALDVRDTWYLLNPGGDLARTQARFQDSFAAQPGWQVRLRKRGRIGWKFWFDSVQWKKDFKCNPVLEC